MPPPDASIWARSSSIGFPWLPALRSPLSGFLLLFPFYGTNIAEMQLAQVVHAVVAVLFVALILAHIYIGTLGMEGAFEAMGTGEVDLNWAKEHHDLWLARQLANQDRQRTALGDAGRMRISIPVLIAELSEQATVDVDQS